MSPIGEIPHGTRLVVALPRPAVVRWHSEDQAGAEVATEDTGLGLHAVELNTAAFATGRQVTFSWTWREEAGAAGDAFHVTVGAAMEG